METASTLVYSKALIAGRETSTGAETVQINGVAVLVRFGYPRDNDNAALVAWRDNLLDLNANEFTIARTTNRIYIYPTDTTAALAGAWPADIGNPAVDERNCFVQYSESDTVGTAPATIEVSPCI